MDAQRMADEHAERLQRMEQRRQQMERERQRVERLRNSPQVGKLKERNALGQMAACIYEPTGDIYFHINGQEYLSLSDKVILAQPCEETIVINGRGAVIK
jgi:hypothetical protein